MTVEIPESVTIKGKVSVTWLPALADISKPTVAELAAGLELTCYFPTEWEGVNMEQSSNEQGRMCTADTWTVLGNTKRTATNVQYTAIPQMLGTPGAPGNEVYEELRPGKKGFLAIRYGKDAREDKAAGDVFDILGVECGSRQKPTKGDNESSPVVVDQGFSSTGVFEEDAVAVAA